MKTISVCISAYEMGGRGPGFLRFSFEKLIAQTFKDFEVIVSDQSKDDEIKKVCENYGDRLDVRYFKEDPIASPSDNTNNALRHAQGKLIKILFLDDFLYKETSLEDIVKNFDFKKDRWLITASIHTRDGVDFYRPFHPLYDDSRILFKNTISAPSVLTMINDDPVLFDSRLVWWQDLDFYKRCYERWGQPRILDGINVAIRTHDHQMGGSSKEKVREDEYRYILKKHRIKGSRRLFLVYKTKRYLRQLKKVVKRALGTGATGTYLSCKKKALNLLTTAYYRIRFYPLVVRFGTTDAAVLEHVLVRKEYGIDYGDLDPKLIIDGGANVGYASVFFAKRFPNADIFSVEPEDSNFRVLQKNASRYPRIHPIKKGLWHKSGRLKIIDRGQGEWTFMTEEASTSDGGGAIEAVTIPEIMRMAGMETIDILKLDIEGAEKELFSANSDAWLGKVNILIIELHDRMKPGSNAAFYAAIAKYGFKLELRGENVILRRSK